MGAAVPKTESGHRMFTLCCCCCKDETAKEINVLDAAALDTSEADPTSMYKDEKVSVQQEANGATASKASEVISTRGSVEPDARSKPMQKEEGEEKRPVAPQQGYAAPQQAGHSNAGYVGQDGLYDEGEWTNEEWGMYYKDAGLYQPAIECFRQALRDNPNLESARLALVSCNEQIAAFAKVTINRSAKRLDSQELKPPIVPPEPAAPPTPRFDAKDEPLPIPFPSPVASAREEKAETVEPVEEPTVQPLDAPPLEEAVDQPAAQEAPDTKLSQESEGLQERPEAQLENGKKYTGQWKGDTQHGQGVMKSSDGTVYEGTFESGKIHGHGVLRKPDGTVYEGNFVQEKAHGDGKFTAKDGSKYVGQWVDDKKSGRGLDSWLDGSTFEGEFAQGSKHGYGTYKSPTGMKYEGQFQKDVMQGEGKYTFPDGRTYEGQWQAGKMHGRGRMNYTNGASYEGGFAFGLQEGEGTITKSGRSEKGVWKKGQRVQEAKNTSDGKQPSSGSDTAMEARKAAADQDRQRQVSNDTNPTLEAQKAAADQDKNKQAGEAKQTQDKQMNQDKQSKPTEKQFEIVLDKTRGQKLGVNIQAVADNTLRIDYVANSKESVLGVWNAENPDNKIIPGDHILEVNGVAGKVDAMIDELKKNQYLACTIRRTQPGSSTAK